MTTRTREEIIAAAKAAAAEKIAKERENTPPVALVYLIDNTVVDIIRTDERLAAIMLSQPLILDLSDVENLNDINAVVGSTYDPETSTFTLPAEEE
jgi:hypothetical protein